jgi:hypothetical protein
VSLDLRQFAASAIAQRATEEARKAIRHFATNPVAEDVKDNLKGCGLSANWPGNFAFAELMPLLTQPRSANNSSGYEAFVVRFANERDTALSAGDLLILMR